MISLLSGKVALCKMEVASCEKMTAEITIIFAVHPSIGRNIYILSTNKCPFVQRIPTATGHVCRGKRGFSKAKVSDVVASGAGEST